MATRKTAAKRPGKTSPAPKAKAPEVPTDIPEDAVWVPFTEHEDFIFDPSPPLAIALAIASDYREKMRAIVPPASDDGPVEHQEREDAENQALAEQLVAAFSGSCLYHRVKDVYRRVRGDQTYAEKQIVRTGALYSRPGLAGMKAFGLVTAEDEVDDPLA